MKHVDEFFREKLGDYTEAPPADAWDEIEGRLDTLKPRPASYPYRRLVHVAMAGLIVLVSIPLFRKYVFDAVNSKPAATIAVTTVSTQNSSGNAPAVPAAPAAGDAIGAVDHNVAVPSAQNPAEGPATTSGNNEEEVTHSSNARVAAATGIKHEAFHSNTGKSTARRPGAKNNAGTTTHEEKPLARRSAAHGPDGNDDAGDDNQKNLTHAGQVSGPSVAKKGPDGKAEAVKDPANKKPAAKPAEKKAPESKPAGRNNHPNFLTHLEAGIKAGFETGFTHNTASSYVISPYVQYNISKKLAVMLQPAVKYASLPDQNVASQPYYKVNDDGMVRETFEQTEVITHGTSSYTQYTAVYNGTQSHDSIIKSYHYGGTYTEFDIPVLLRYSLSASLGVYGGVDLQYSRTSGITEKTFVEKGIVRSINDTLVTTTPPVAPSVADLITYSGKPYQDYQGPLYTAQPQGLFRLGYTFGFNYEYHKWLFDALTQISPVKPVMKGGYDIHSSLSSPYVRFTIGYKLTK